MNHFFAYMARMKNIHRWGLMRNIQQENIQEHSHQVAIIAHNLALLHNRFFLKPGETPLDAEHIMALGIYHETSEVLTGDLPTPIKYYNDEIRDTYHAIEGWADERMLNMLPEELREDYRPYITDRNEADYRYVKAADKMSAYLKCLEEQRGGNSEFDKAAQKIRTQLEDMAMPEVTYFLEHFAESFKLTLDELN